MPLASLPDVLLLAFVAVVGLYDLVNHRIPNVLTVPGALCGLVVCILRGGPGGALHSMMGVAVGLGVFLPFYLARGFSAGDVKALGAIGAFLGPKGVLLASAWTLFIGAVFGIAILLARGGSRALLALTQRWRIRVGLLVTTGSAAGVVAEDGDPARHRFPYGIAIAFGTIASLLWS